MEGVTSGYYVVFDYRSKREAREEKEAIEGKAIVSYVIPVVGERPSNIKSAGSIAPERR